MMRPGTAAMTEKTLLIKKIFLNIAFNIELPLTSIVAHVTDLAEDRTFIPRPVVHSSHAPGQTINQQHV
jgi:hypothetical protein